MPTTPAMTERTFHRLSIAAAGALTLIAVTVCATLLVDPPWPTAVEAVDRWGSPLGFGLAAFAICARALRPGRVSIGWLLIGVGVVLWGGGELYYSAVLWTADPMPFPSLADAGWVAFYVPTFAGIVLLARERAGAGAASVLDGVIAALAITGVGAAIAFGPIVEATGGSQLAIATNLAYPLGDLALIAVVFGAIAAGGWRVTPEWAALSAGLVLFGVADTVYLFQIA